MKRVLVIPFLAAIACAPAPSFGQSLTSGTSAAAPSPSVRRVRVGSVAPLTPEEETILKAARDKARQDPAVEAAAQKMDAAMKAAHAAMVAKDKSIGPLLDQVEASSSPGALRPLFTPEETAQLRAAREAIKGTPEAEAWQTATVDHYEAQRKAEIAADPAVEAILNKLSGMRRRLIVVSGSPEPSASASPH